MVDEVASVMDEIQDKVHGISSNKTQLLTITT